MNASFETLIETHRDVIFRASMKLCHGDRAMAEDMVQETYLKAIRHADRFTPGTNLRGWLMRILYNNVISVFRHRQVAREGPYPSGFDPAELAKVDLEVSDEIQQAVGELPSDHRQVFLMAALDDFPYREIAKKLGIPMGTVMSRLWRARRTLRDRLSTADLN